MSVPETLALNPGQPPLEAVRYAVREVRRRHVVAAPTDTLYGLLADARDTIAVRRVFRAKRRPRSRPIPLLFDSMSAVHRVSSKFPDGFERLAAAFWPGALTIVVPAASHLPRLVTGGRGTVAVRVPRTSLVRSIARQARCPLTGTSANLSGRRPPRTASGVVSQVGAGISLVLDGGPVRRAVPSTIVDLCGTRPVLLRPGVVAAQAIDRVLNDGRGRGLSLLGTP